MTMSIPRIAGMFLLSPINENIRALNLSNCVAIVLYEVLRQNDYFDLLRVEPHKGEDYLEK